MTIVVEQRVTITCDRCGRQVQGQVPEGGPSIPQNWRQLTMMHPDTGEPLTWHLHPECARDLSELFMANVDCPARP